jgi:sporulation protein YlmC with PRC-barrel domain
MGVMLSRMYGMDIYSVDAGYIGKVNDIILNLESGEVVRLTTNPIREMQSSSAKAMISKNSVLFKRVKSVQDIVLVGGLRAE